MNNKQVAQELVKIARVLLSKEKALDELNGAVQFVPKYNGISFVVADDGIYKRGPNQSEAFRDVRLQDVVGELRLRDEDDVISVIQNNWKSKKKMIRELKNTGRFKTKIL